MGRHAQFAARGSSRWPAQPARLSILSLRAACDDSLTAQRSPVLYGGHCQVPAAAATGSPNL